MIRLLAHADRNMLKFRLTSRTLPTIPLYNVARPQSVLIPQNLWPGFDLCRLLHPHWW